MRYSSQRDEPHAKMKLGKTNLTMERWGCFVTSLSYLANLTPQATLEALNSANAFDHEGKLYSDVASKALNLKYTGKTKSVPSGKAVPCIVECDASEKVGVQQHFCAYLGKLNGKPVIIDPWDGTEKFCPYKIVSYRLFRAKADLKITISDVQKEMYPAKPPDKDEAPIEEARQNYQNLVKEDILNGRAKIWEKVEKKSEQETGKERKAGFWAFLRRLLGIKK